MDGTDVLAVYEAVSKAVDYARSGKGPYLVETLVYRWWGHYCGDPCAYRPKEYLEEGHAHDPVRLFRELLIAEGAASGEECDAAERDRMAEIDAAYAFACASEYPDAAEAFTDVYSEDNERSVF